MYNNIYIYLIGGTNAVIDSSTGSQGFEFKARNYKLQLQFAKYF